MRRVVLASLVVAALATPAVLADKNINDIKKVESELDDAQQRLENVKQRMMGEEGNTQSAGLADKIASVLEAAKARVGGSSDESVADLAARKAAEGKDALNGIGSESISEKAARRVREALGRDTLADKAQHLYNDAVDGLQNSGLGDKAGDLAADAKDRLNNLGSESISEKTARKVREALGRETSADIAVRKYLEAKDALGQVRNINFAEMPEQAQKIKDRLQALGEQALASATGQIDAVQDAIEPSTWEKLKVKLGLKAEPTAQEKAALVAEHLKAQAADKANELKDAALNKYGKVKVASAFNDFLGKIGSSPTNAVNLAKEWVGLDSEAREKRKHEKQISKEAHEALDDLLQKLLDDVDNDPSKVESIQVSVKAQEKHTSFVQRIKDRLVGNKDDAANIDAAGGYEGMKNKISELIDAAKLKLGKDATEAEVESYVEKAYRKIREAKDKIPSSADLKDAANAVGSETLAERAGRKVREALGRDTTADKIHHKVADLKDSANSVDTASISEKLHGYVDSAKDKLHRSTPDESAADLASRKYQDAKDTISGFGQESLTERAARKVREALGRETASDKAHRQIDEAREMYVNAMANMPDSASLQDKIASFGTESYAEKAARKVREALGQETASDKAHRKLAEGKDMLETFNAAALKEKLNAVKDKVTGAADDVDTASIKDRVANAYENAKASASDLKDSASNIGSESLTDKAGRKVREALGRDTTADKIHHKVADAKDAYNTHSTTITDKINEVKDSILSLGQESLAEKAARKVREALGRETAADKAQAQVESARDILSNLNAEALKNKAADLKDAAVEKANNAKDAVLNKLSTEEAPKVGKLTQIKEAVFGNAKDNKIEAAEKQLQEALKKLEQARAL